MKKTVLLILITLIFSCPDRDERCVSCFEKSCRLCYDSFLDSSATCQTSSISVDYCLQYSTIGVCKYCENGYNANSAGKCEKIKIDKCLIQNGLTDCAQCENGILVKDGKCDEKNKCLSKNCERCAVDENGKEKCTLCKDGFSILIDNGNFICKNAGLENCVYMKADESKECAICRVNYYWKNGLCEKSTKYSVNFVELKGIFVLVFILLLNF